MREFVICAHDGRYFVNYSPARGMVLGSAPEASGYTTEREAKLIRNAHGSLRGAVIVERESEPEE